MTVHLPRACANPSYCPVSDWTQGRALPALLMCSFSGSQLRLTPLSEVVWLSVTMCVCLLSSPRGCERVPGPVPGGCHRSLPVAGESPEGHGRHGRDWRRLRVEMGVGWKSMSGKHCSWRRSLSSGLWSNCAESLCEEHVCKRFLPRSRRQLAVHPSDPLCPARWVCWRQGFWGAQLALCGQRMRPSSLPPSGGGGRCVADQEPWQAKEVGGSTLWPGDKDSNPQLVMIGSEESLDASQAGCGNLTVATGT